MRVSINSLLYAGSAVMFGWAAWLFYTALTGDPPIGGRGENVSVLGHDVAEELVGLGRGMEDQDESVWDETWFRKFAEVNLTGRRQEADQSGTRPPPEPPEEVMLEEIFELVSLMYHDPRGDEVPLTHVILRYRPQAGARMPEELQPKLGGEPTSGGPPILANPIRERSTRGRPAPTTSPRAQPEILVDHVAVGEVLWEPHDHIRLVRVAPDAQVAYFRRAGLDPEGRPYEVEAVSRGRLGQGLLRATTLQSSVGEKDLERRRPLVGGRVWIDVNKTRELAPGEFVISRADDRVFRENPQRFLDQVTIRTYRSSGGDPSRSGVQLTAVDPEFGRRFGLRTGDVILALNNAPVRTRAEAIDVAQEQYRRGVRVFEVRMMTRGRIEERVYRAPDR